MPIASIDLLYDLLYMTIEVIKLTPKHRELLSRLSELIPDLEPNSPESLQRVFGLGLIALTMQITNRAREKQQEDLVDELGALAREIVESEDWDNSEK